MPTPPGAPFSVCLASVASGPDTSNGQWLSPCLGTGRTIAAASRRARAEYAERVSGFFRGDESRVVSSYRALGTRAIHPNDCLLVSREQLNRRATGGFRTFPERARVAWTPVISVRTGRLRFLPTQLLYLGFPTTRGLEYGGADSNGAAAGRSVADAALRGLLELVERDSVAIWWYNRIRRPRVLLDRAPHPSIRRLHAWVESIGRECWMLDLTHDLGIPVFVAVSRMRRPGRSGERIHLGFGAHPERLRAARRALTEMGQSIAVDTAVQQGHLEPFPPSARWLRHGTLADEPQLAPSDDPPIALRAGSARRTSVEWFRHCRRRIERAGLEVFLLDQSRADVGMTVIKAVVPGLRPWWTRFAKGRLFDVPVALGWRDRRASESNLNPRELWM